VGKQLTPYTQVCHPTEKDSLELQMATHFMQWVTPYEPSHIVKLDVKSDRKRPDFAFYYSSGQCYILELKRWLTKELRNIEDFLNKNVAEPLNGGLPDTFILRISLDEVPNGTISKKQLTDIVSEIRQVIGSANQEQPYQLSLGSLYRVSNGGHRLVAQITRPELLYPDEGMVKELRDLLNKYVAETDVKFLGYSGTRVLLLDISQCGLDIDYHASYSKEGPGVIIRWVTEASKSSTNIDYICVWQSYPIWGATRGNMTRILTGHRHVDKPAPNYKEVWRRSGLAPIQT